MNYNHVPIRTLKEKDDTVTGILMGYGKINTDDGKPWKYVVIDNGSYQEGITMSYQIYEFFKKVNQHIGLKDSIGKLKVTITNTGEKIDTGQPAPMSLMQIDIDENTLPKNFQRSKLNPVEVSPDFDSVFND